MILGAVREYALRRGATVIIVSHSMDDMAELCDRVVVVAEGRILCEGTRDEVFGKAELLIGAGLDIPELTHVSRLLAERGYKTQRQSIRLTMPQPRSLNYTTGTETK